MKVTLRELHDLIGSQSRHRGEVDFSARNVNLDIIKNNFVQATVVGTKVYKTILEKKETSNLTGNCSCPAYNNYGPCKHMMGLGLALIEHYSEGGYEASDKCINEVEKHEKFKKGLKKMKKTELIDILVQIGKKYNLQEFFVHAPSDVEVSEDDDYYDFDHEHRWIPAKYDY